MSIDIPQKVTSAYTQSSLQNRTDLVRPAYSSQTVNNVNFRAVPVPKPQPVPQPMHQSAAQTALQAFHQPAPQPVQQASVPYIKDMTIPQLSNLLQKGQKAALESGVRHLTFGFGWNVRDSRCDIDASAFLVTDTGKVPGDDWFVFYGQDTSPDGSTAFRQGSTDRENITVDLTKLDSRIRKVIFVLTINEAFAQHLNFSMIRDPYVRIMDTQTGRVLLSYRMEELYANVTSMTIGELYLHNGAWKFNPVGNGVQQDLAGQCAIYGVAIE